ncbi:MAG: type II toxin-antitoxin system prevent-host-death family antitoxin [Ignavibacteria bacterium CG_4_9_14_3_um_filter_36_18]|nr:MAG: type II toxin-antitoxin system prevent-host-death family antitoxin [Ignavibacteria bacterium CG_4_9_14_3_um_filter_36_18]
MTFLKGKEMQAIIYTEARNKLNKLIDKVHENSEPYLIVGTKGRKDAILISKEEYDNLIENLYILSNPKWVKSIEQGLDDFKRGKTKKLTIKEALGI